MKLEFDSINELEQFLMFSAHIGRAFATAPTDAGQIAADISLPKLTEEEAAYAAAGYPNALPPETQAQLSAMLARNPEGVIEPATTAQGEDGPLMADGGTPAKRKRRTKAEIEAERSAAGKVPNVPAAGQTATSVEPSVSASPSNSANATGSNNANPFAVASPATQAILKAPNQSAATLAGMAAMQTDPPVDGDPVAPRVVESIEHLRACQSFIQAHGMARYNESFRNGLNANITTYTPEQRAQHVAILETLALSA